MAIDMQAIKEAIARRGGEGGTPAVNQMTPPSGTTPGGGPNTPATPPTAQPTPQPGNQQIPNAKGIRTAAQKIVSSNFDDETRGLAKNLILKLISVL